MRSAKPTKRRSRPQLLRILTLALVIVFALLTACSTTTNALPPGASKDSAVDIDYSGAPKEFIAHQTNPPPPSKRGNPKTYTALGKRYWVKRTSAGYKEQGLASWYGPKFHGRPTSSGEPFDMHQVTAAHKSLPIPTYVRVTRLDDGRSLIVKVNDRGPFIESRIIDLSYAAANKLGMVKAGTVPVEVVALAPYQHLDRDKDTVPKVAKASPKASPKIKPTTSQPTSKQRADYIAEPLPPTLQLVSLNKPKQAIPRLISTARPSPATYIQVGSFSLLRNAEYMRSRLRQQLGYPIIIISADERLHKLHVGPINGKDEDIDTLKFQLAQLGLNQTDIIHK